jgi:hypothetical protein
MRVSGSGAGGWKIAQNAGQSMLIKNSPAAVSTTVGVAGYLLGEQYSPVELQYAGNGLFIATSHEGTIIPY